MDIAPIEQQLLELVRPLLDEPVEISPDTDLVAEIGLPSLKIMELIAEIEDIYDVSYPLNDLAEVRTISDLAKSVQRLVP